VKQKVGFRPRVCFATSPKLYWEKPTGYRATAATSNYTPSEVKKQPSRTALDAVLRRTVPAMARIVGGRNFRKNNRLAGCKIE
jgi:hypothetical protein